MPSGAASASTIGMVAPRMRCESRRDGAQRTHGERDPSSSQGGARETPNKKYALNKLFLD
jgi:hypothetical protein